MRIASILVFFCMAFIVTADAALKYTGQDQVEAKLAPKYKAFLAETQMIMMSEEREVFQDLKTDEERDQFIRQFWKSRGGRQQGVRANINLLRFMRMVQVLDLTEDQIAKILPVMNQTEKEKQRLQRDIQNHLREMLLLLGEESRDEQKLVEILGRIKQLKTALREKEKEFDEFLADHLSVVQQAEYIVFSQEFYRGLQEQLQRARRLREQIRK